MLKIGNCGYQIFFKFIDFIFKHALTNLKILFAFFANRFVLIETFSKITLVGHFFWLIFLSSLSASTLVRPIRLTIFVNLCKH